MIEAANVSDTPQPAAHSFWEDVIDIFFSPVGVFARRANDGFWKPYLFVVIVIGVVGFATFDTLQPVFEAEFNRGMATQGQKLTPEQIESARNIMLKVSKFVFPLAIAFAMILVGFGTWIVSKIFGAKTTLSQAFMVMAWSYFPRILGTIAGGVQGLLMDPSKLNSAQAITLSPARFMDVTTANPLVFQLAGRFDVFIIWETILLAIGVYVTGRISKGSAVGFGILMFVLGSLQAIRQGFMAM